MGDYLSILSYLSRKVYALEPEKTKKAEDFLKISVLVNHKCPA